MDTFLLAVHIIGVSIWLGSNVVIGVVSSRLRVASAEVNAWWADTTGFMARVLYNVAGVLILFTGIALVLRDRGEFSDKFVAVGFVAIIIGAALGMAVFGPGSRKLALAHREGRTAEAAALNNRLAGFGVLDSAVVIFTIVAMIEHWV